MSGEPTARSNPRTPKPRATTAPRPAKVKATPLPAGKAVGILESQRQLGGPSYPPSLARLAELAGEPLTAVLKVLGTREVKARVRLTRAATAAKVSPETTFVLLVEDTEIVARDDRLLSAQLTSARTQAVRAADPAGLAKGMPPELGKAFKAALVQRVADRHTPPGIAALPGKKPLFFFVEDAVLPRVEPPGLVAAAPRPAGVLKAEVESRFEAAFTALDRASGAHNYVTLAALRAALPDIPRAELDAALSALRRQRRYTLDPSDGRHQQMTQQEREAGIMEAGNLLVYVARRSEG